MTERPTPYIGMSGVVETAQQYYLMDQYIWQGLDDLPLDRQIGLGVKAVHKTQYLDIENKYGPEWYPVGERPFSSALEAAGGAALRMAQVYFDPDHVSDPAYRNSFVDRISQRGQPWMNTLQFDMLPWHDDRAMLPFLDEVKAATGHNIILQVHGEAMSTLGPGKVVEKLARHATSIDYVLFDASHGKGVRMNPATLRPFIDAAYGSEALGSTGIGLAGGLSADVVREDLAPIVRNYPDISWDAEGQLHPFDEWGKRPIDMQRAKQYLQASADILKEV